MKIEIIYGRHPIFEALSAGKRKFKKLFIAKHYEGEIVDKIIALARKGSLKNYLLPNIMKVKSLIKLLLLQEKEMYL